MYFLIRWLIRRLRRPAAGMPEAPAEVPGGEPAAAGPGGDRFAGWSRRAAPAGTTGAPALSVHGLTKRFRERVAFDDVSFEIGYGEVFGFLGPNGAGKPVTGL